MSDVIKIGQKYSAKIISQPFEIPLTNGKTIKRTLELSRKDILELVRKSTVLSNESEEKQKEFIEEFTRTHIKLAKEQEVDMYDLIEIIEHLVLLINEKIDELKTP